MRVLLSLGLLLLATTALASTELKLRNTYYYVVLENEYTRFEADTDVLGVDGAIIARVSHAFLKATDIEGTGRLLDGRVINFAKRVDGQIRYKVTPAHWGLGVGTCELKPWATIAIDPGIVPLGSLVHIKETEGMLLPDGTRHDGLWRADDIGSAIKKDRVDLFVGDGNQGHVLVAHGIRNLDPLTVKIVAAPPANNCADQQHP